MIFRQGDIYLIKVSAKAVPKNYVTHRAGPCVVGYGEVTGHKHVITQAQWLVDVCHDINTLREFAENGRSDSTIFVRVTEPAILTHDEHDSLQLPRGIYHVVRQREYTPGELRYVRD